jgi:TonB family protein
VLSGLLHLGALLLRPATRLEHRAPPLHAAAFVVDLVHENPRAEVAAASQDASPAEAAPRTPARAPKPAAPAATEAPSPVERSAVVAAAPAPTASAKVTAEPVMASTPAEPTSPVAGEPVASASVTALASSSSLGTASGSSPGTAAGARVGTSSTRAASTAASVLASRTLYLRRLTARIRQYRQYPYLARRQGLEGTVCLRIQLGARGQLMALRVTCGGASAPLVEAAKTAVIEAAPFEPLPADLGTSLAVEVPIVFRLEEG